MKKIILAVSIVVFIMFVSGCAKEPVPIQTLYPNDVKMWENIFSYEPEDKPYEFETAPRGVVLPHHSVTSFNVNTFYKSLAEVTTPSMVVVISPNHFEGGLYTVQTCEACVYETTVGDLELDADFIDDMVDDEIAFYADEVFIDEHGIFSHAPFIKNYFPDAPLVPILMNWETPDADIKNLSDYLETNLPEDALVVASIDFSHYVPDTMAEFHDKATLATITNFDYKNIFDLEIDSPASLYAFLGLMERWGAMKTELVNYSNLTDFITEHEEETTSHMYLAFTEGKAEPYKSVSILSVGNMPDGHTMDFMTNWKWDPNYNEGLDHGTTRLLTDIKMKEDRFFVGADYLVFDLSDGECINEEQNGMKIAFCNFIEDPNREREYLNIISEAADEVDLVYLLFEYQNGGELDYDRKYFTRALAKKGVDIFVGRGFKEVELFEYYRGALLFHNLGEFVIDNEVITDLNSQNAGMVVGLHVTEDDFYIYLFPIDVVNGVPSLSDYSKRTTLFKIYQEDVTLTHRDEADDSKGIIQLDR